MYNINNRSKPTKNLAAPNPKFVFSFVLLGFRAKITEITGQKLQIEFTNHMFQGFRFGFFGGRPPHAPPPAPPAQSFGGGAWGGPKCWTCGGLGGPPPKNMGGPGGASMKINETS